MNRMDKLLKIKDYLCDIEKSIEFDTRADLFDINKHCENFYCGLLNIVYDYNLKNANIDSKNYSSVDLIDDTSGIYFQVTSNNTRDKVQTTIDSLSKKIFIRIIN